MNDVDNYSAFFTAQMPGDPSVGVLYSDHGDRMEYNILPRKRPRKSPPSFLSDDISSELLQQTQDVDRLILYHAEKVRAELSDCLKRYWRQALAAVEECVPNLMRVKDEEIQRIQKLNLALEERVRLLILDSQIWRELAQSNEAAVMVLKNNLEQILITHVRRQGTGAAEDAESCCGGDEERQDCHNVATGSGRICRNCGDGEASVLLLPCRHLCLCSACGPAVNACPVCKCSKVGSLNVNLV